MTGGAPGGRAALWLLAAGTGLLAVCFLLPLGAAWDLAPNLGHGWAAPGLAGYLWWERWNQRPPLRTGLRPGWAAWAVAAAVGAAALPLQLLLRPYPLWPALLWAHSLLLVGAACAAAWMLAGGPGLRWLAAPLIVLAGALPWTSGFEQQAILPLRRLMAEWAAECCNLLGHPAIASGTGVHVGPGWIGVDEACGGIRSLQAAVMIALFFGEWIRAGLARRFVLVGIGIAAAIAANFLRVCFLAVRQSAGGAAFDAAHDAAGWTALALSLVAVAALAWRWRPGSADKPRARQPFSADAVMPVAACVAAGALLLTFGQLASWAWFARGQSAAPPVRWRAALPAAQSSFRVVPLTESAGEMLRPDSYAAGTWLDGADRRCFAYYIEWRKGEIARFLPFLHNPTVCLPLSGCDLVRPLDPISVTWQGRTIPFQCYLFNWSGEDLAVAFVVWDTDRDCPLAPPSETNGKLAWLRGHWAEVRAGRQAQRAQMLSVGIEGPDGAEHLRESVEELISRP